MLGFRLYLAQRLTAVIMAPLVLLHLGVMIYAIRGGLDASEILGRTQGSVLWATVYGLFVICAAIHGAIGLRVVLHEVMGPARRFLDLFTWVVVVLLLALGLRAVYAVVMP